MGPSKEELQKEIEQGMSWLEAFDRPETRKAEALLTYIERLSEQIDRIFLDEAMFQRDESVQAVRAARRDTQ